MNENPTPPAPAKTPVGGLIILTVALLIALCAAIYFYVASNKANEALAQEKAAASAAATAASDENAALKGQLEDAEKQIATLQPLAEKARQLPITTRIDRHAPNAGYNLFIYNRSREPLRLNITIDAGGRTKNILPVVDGGRMFMVHTLAPHDTVAIGAEGYDTKTITIE